MTHIPPEAQHKRKEFIYIQKASLQLAEQKGLEKGFENGLEKGENKGLVKVAKNMLQTGIEKQLVAQTTGLSIVEIESLEK